MHFKTYSATGNIIGIAYYPDLSTIEKFVASRQMRRRLKQLGIAHGCDSIMVLVKDLYDTEIIHTVVFEPNNETSLGIISTMCGNGVRALAAYAEKYMTVQKWPLKVVTQSGTLEIQKLDDQTYRVLMGTLFTDTDSLKRYVSTGLFTDAPILTDVPLPQTFARELPLPFAAGRPVCSIGFTSTQADASRADGEPHMIIELGGSSVGRVESLQKIAKQYGPLICKNRTFFPSEINVNFVAHNPIKPDSVLNCTFERNLGNDAKKCVTQACGTGSTVVAAERMRKTGLSKISVRCLGGKLHIERLNNLFYLSGDVQPVQTSPREFALPAIPTAL